MLEDEGKSIPLKKIQAIQPLTSQEETTRHSRYINMRKDTSPPAPELNPSYKQPPLELSWVNFSNGCFGKRSKDGFVKYEENCQKEKTIISHVWTITITTITPTTTVTLDRITVQVTPSNDNENNITPTRNENNNTIAYGHCTMGRDLVR